MKHPVLMLVREDFDDLLVKDDLESLAELVEEEIPQTMKSPFTIQDHVDDDPTLEIDVNGCSPIDEMVVMVPVKTKVFRISSGVHSFTLPVLSDVEEAVKKHG